MNDNHTYQEIRGQIKSWEQNYDQITDPKLKIITDLFSKDFDRIIFFGCGTSYNLAMAASFFTNTVSKFDSTALTSSELLFNSETYIKNNKKYLLIGFSRSGETTETVEVTNQFRSNNNIRTFAFTCRDSNSFIDVSDGYYVCQDAKEESVAMTRSFSTMLFSYCIMLSVYLKDKDRLEEFYSLCTFLENKMTSMFNDIKNYIDTIDFNSYFALGSGFNYPLAVEADLKMKEMSQTPSYSYHIFEFNHGPKALLSANCLVLLLTISRSLKNVDIIVNEILKNRAKIAVVGKDIAGIKKSKDVKTFLEDANFKDELVKSFINIPVFQIFAYMQTIKQNLNPDSPKGLDYTTKLNI